jgi:hypothetical protein
MLIASRWLPQHGEGYDARMTDAVSLSPLHVDLAQIGLA